MGSKILSFVLVVLFYSNLHASPMTCTDVFKNQSADFFFQIPDTTADAFRKEMDQFVSELSRYESIMKLANEIESSKEFSGQNKRRTRNERDQKIRMWRFYLRTGDLFEIIESMRNLYDNVKGSAILFAKAEAYLLILETPAIRSQLSEAEYTHFKKMMEDLALEQSNTLVKTYADYSAAEMVLGELKQANRAISDQQLDVVQFQQKMKQELPELSAQELRAKQEIEAAQEFFDLIQNRLPIGDVMKTTFPQIFNRDLVIDKNFIRSVFRGHSSLYGGKRPPHQEFPLRKTLERDLESQQRGNRLYAFYNFFGEFMQFFISKIQYIPGKGYSLEDISKAEGALKKTAMTFNSASSGLRQFMYLFVRTFENIRATENYVPDFYRLETIRDNRGDEQFFQSVVKMASNNPVDFFTHFSRLGDNEVQKDFMKFKLMLNQKIEEYSKEGVESIFYASLKESLEAGELRGKQLGLLSTLPKSRWDRITGAVVIVGGVSYTGLEAYNYLRPMVESIDPSQLWIIGPLFGQ